MGQYTVIAQGVRDFYLEQYILEPDEIKKKHLLATVMFWTMEALNHEVKPKLVQGRFQGLGT